MRGFWCRKKGTGLDDGREGLQRALIALAQLGRRRSVDDPLRPQIGGMPAARRPEEVLPTALHPAVEGAPVREVEVRQPWLPLMLLNALSRLNAAVTLTNEGLWNATVIPCGNRTHHVPHAILERSRVRLKPRDTFPLERVRRGCLTRDRFPCVFCGRDGAF